MKNLIDFIMVSLHVERMLTVVKGRFAVDKQFLEPSSPGTKDKFNGQQVFLA